MRHLDLRIAALALSALAFAGCARQPAAPADMGRAAAPPAGLTSVSGTVTYRERVALPPTAVVTVQLVDAARADAPATVLAEQVIETQGRQIPIGFSLTVPAAAVAPPARLLLQAHITVDGAMRFATRQAVPVPYEGLARPIELLVKAAHH